MADLWCGDLDCTAPRIPPGGHSGSVAPTNIEFHTGRAAELPTHLAVQIVDSERVTDARSCRVQCVIASGPQRSTTGAGSPRAAIWRSSWDGPVITSALAGPLLVTVKLCGISRGTKTKLPAPAVQLSSPQ
jgi:hypothetical protein